MFPRKAHWLSLLIAFSWLSQSMAAEKSKLPYPKLVVGIHIDQLEKEYLQWFMEGFGEDGFKKLLNEGCVYPQVAYEIARKDAASSVASIVCGCPPRYHGIIGESIYDRKLNALSSIMADADYLGNFTNERYSPKAIKTSTIADELKVATNHAAKVFSLGVNAEACIISGGQYADGVFWRDNQSGLWCSSTYYSAMPRWIENVNDFQLRDRKFDKMVWQPKYPLGKYIHMPHQKSSLIFHYSLAKLPAMSDRIKQFKQTPMANEELCRMAIDLIGIERLGQDKVPDLLNLHFNLGSHVAQHSQQSSLEIQDLYFRLDDDIAMLLKELDKKIGLEHVLIYVVGSAEATFPVDEQAASFYPDRTATLLNLFLSAKYGSGNWVQGYSDTDIYLNRLLIEQKSLPFENICREAALFLTEVEGVEQVFVGLDFNFQNQPDDYYQNSHYASRSGDLSLRLQQGRNIEWHSYPHYNQQLRYHQEHSLLIFYGHQVETQRIASEVSIFNIAPSICQELFIRPPTGNRGSILPNFMMP